jgi:predicted  nucleic acid-binding Zn-ribbon protein
VITTKHGKYYNKTYLHVILRGSCPACGCEFETYVNIIHDDPEKGRITFITDKDCTDMQIDPEFDYWEHWSDDYRKYTAQSTRVLRSVNYSCWCPECRTDVQLFEDRMGKELVDEEIRMRQMR